MLNKRIVRKCPMRHVSISHLISMCLVLLTLKLEMAIVLANKSVLAPSLHYIAIRQEGDDYLRSINTIVYTLFTLSIFGQVEL